MGKIKNDKLKKLDEITEVFKRYTAFRDRVDSLYNNTDNLEKLENEKLTNYITTYGYTFGIEEYVINEDNNKDYYYTAEDVDDYIKNNHPEFSNNLFEPEQKLIALHNRICEKE